MTTDDDVALHVEIEEPGPRVSPPAAGEQAAPVVVLSHGYTLDRRCWIYQRRALVAAGYRVLLWDQRGHGRSGKAGSSDYTIDRLGSDLACVISSAVPEGPVLLVGHSMGGMAIMALAEHHRRIIQERVVAVAFIDSSSGEMHRVDWGLGERAGGWINRVGPRVTAALAPYQHRVRDVLAALPWLGKPAVAASSFGSKVPTTTSTLTTQMMVQTDFQVTSAFAPTLTAHDKREAMVHLSHLPALVMVGDRDVLTPQEHSDVLARELPQAVYVVVRRAGHIMVLEHPELVADYLVDLLGRLKRAQRTAALDPDAHRAPAPTEGSGPTARFSTDLRHDRGRAALTVGSAT